MRQYQHWFECVTTSVSTKNKNSTLKHSDIDDQTSGQIVSSLDVTRVLVNLPSTMNNLGVDVCLRCGNSWIRYNFQPKDEGTFLASTFRLFGGVKFDVVRDFVSRNHLRKQI